MERNPIRDMMPLERESLGTRVMRELESMILSEELEPGSRVNEKAIADRLNISRSPIREAFRRLEQAGLVEIRVNRGVFVRKVDYGRADELTDIRCALYQLAGRLAAKNIENGQIHELRDGLARMERALEVPDPEGYSEINDRFHRNLIEASGSQRLRDLLEGIEKELSLARHLSRRSRDRNVLGELTQSVQEHRAIIDALAVRDPVRAGNEMEFHAHRGKRQVLAFFDTR